MAASIDPEPFGGFFHEPHRNDPDPSGRSPWPSEASASASAFRRLFAGPPSCSAARRPGSCNFRLAVSRRHRHRQRRHPLRQLRRSLECQRPPEVVTMRSSIAVVFFGAFSGVVRTLARLKQTSRFSEFWLQNLRYLKAGRQTAGRFLLSFSREGQALIVPPLFSRQGFASISPVRHRQPSRSKPVFQRREDGVTMLSRPLGDFLHQEPIIVQELGRLGIGDEVRRLQQLLAARKPPRRLRPSGGAGSPCRSFQIRTASET